MQYLRHLVDGEEHLLILKSPLTILNHYKHNRIFLNKDIKMIVEEVLLSAGIAAADFEFKTRAQYPQYEFIAQYNETDHAFMQRMIAYHGIYYRYQHSELKTTISFYDNSDDSPLIKGKSTLQYSVPTGTVHSTETAYSLHQCTSLLTDNSYLKDYNYRTPEAALEISSNNTSDVSGSGSHYHYGDNFLNLESGQQLSKIKQQSLDWQRKITVIETDCRAIEPGSKITITDHPDDNRNGDFIIIGVEKMHANQRAAQLVNFGGKTPANDEGDKTKTFFAKLKLIKSGTNGASLHRSRLRHPFSTTQRHRSRRQFFQRRHQPPDYTRHRAQPRHPQPSQLPKQRRKHPANLWRQRTRHGRHHRCRKNRAVHQRQKQYPEP